MDQYIGLDVSLNDTAISIREGGKRIWRGKCASDPQALADMIRKHAPFARRVVWPPAQQEWNATALIHLAKWCTKNPTQRHA